MGIGRGRGNGHLAGAAAFSLGLGDVACRGYGKLSYGAFQTAARIDSSGRTGRADSDPCE
jgi:hypothetical protein